MFYDQLFPLIFRVNGSLLHLMRCEVSLLLTNRIGLIHHLGCERVCVERERRERPPRRYDKNGEDEAKSEA